MMCESAWRGPPSASPEDYAKQHPGVMKPEDAYRASFGHKFSASAVVYMETPLPFLPPLLHVVVVVHIVVFRRAPRMRTYAPRPADARPVVQEVIRGGRSRHRSPAFASRKITSEPVLQQRQQPPRQGVFYFDWLRISEGVRGWLRPPRFSPFYFLPAPLPLPRSLFKSAGKC